MDVLVTAGGTSEPIDNVRSITNHSGGLGKAIAESFSCWTHRNLRNNQTCITSNPTIGLIN